MNFFNCPKSVKKKIITRQNTRTPIQTAEGCAQPKKTGRDAPSPPPAPHGLASSRTGQSRQEGRAGPPWCLHTTRPQTNRLGPLPPRPPQLSSLSRGSWRMGTPAVFLSGGPEEGVGRVGPAPPPTHTHPEPDPQPETRPSAAGLPTGSSVNSCRPHAPSAPGQVLCAQVSGSHHLGGSDAHRGGLPRG